MFTFSRFFGKRSATRTRGSAQARGIRKTGRSALVLENLEARTTPTASVFTDLADYAPGDTALITAQGFAPGSTLELQVIHVSGMGDDGIYGTPDDVPGNNTGEGHEPWRITDGGAGDLDRVANGVILTTWYVNPDDSYLERFLLTAKGTGGDMNFGTGDDEFASHTFTDASGSTNKVYQHWADAGLGDWNNNILNDQKSNYFEGEVVPHVFIYKASNSKPLVNGQSYSFDISYNYYEQNTNSGGFAYISTFNKDRAPGALGVTNPYIAPSADDGFTNGGGMQGNFYTVDANITSVSPVTILGSGTLDAKVSVTFTYTGATTSNGVAEVYYGLYLARPGDVPNQGKGTTLGSSAWTGGSLQTTVETNSSGATSIQLAPPALIDGEINGIKFHDRNGNGVQDTGDEPLAGWTIFLDLNNSKSWETGEPKTLTDANGFYTFSVIPDANRSTSLNDPYIVREEVQSDNGWVQTVPGSGFFTCLVTAETPQYTGLKFGNTKVAALGDFVWNDINGDGVQDLGEPGLSGVTVSLLDGSGNPIINKITNTDVNGYYSFTGLLPGSYSVQFTAPMGYAFTVNDNSPNDASDSDAISSDVDPFTGKTGVITLSSGEINNTVDAGLFEVVADFEFAKDVRSVSGGNGNGLADWAGDVITYQIGMQNTGNITLTGVSVLDEVESYTGTAAVYESGDTDGDGDLDVGESWLFTATYTLTQDDLDGKGGGDGFLNNIATGSANEVDPKSDSELVPLVYGPNFVIAKDVRSVTGGNGNGVADWAGDVITYQIGMQNTGNVTLTSVTVQDQVESYGATGAVLESGDTDLDGDLDVGESWILRATYTLTQADLDNRGGGDGYLDNVVTGNTRQVGPKSDRERLDLVYDPDFVIAKDVRSVTGGNGNGVADWAGDVITYQIGMQNIGNITLTSVTIQDQVESYGATGAVLESGDTDLDGDLDVGESWILRATYMLTQADLDNRGGGDGYLDNVATGNTREVGPKSDREHLELVYNANFAIAKDVRSVTGGNGNSVADWAGDVITYQIGMQNIGNITLTGVTVLDQVESYGVTGAILESGDTDLDGDLDVGESWILRATYTLTQADLDNRGGGDGYLDNVATGNTREVGPESDRESLELVYNPNFVIAKDVRSVTGGNGNGVADWAGDVITYQIGMQNIGNITLTGVTVLDQVESYGVTGAILESGDTDLDGDLDVGESWILRATYTLTQADLDNRGGGDDYLDNVATGNTREVGPESDRESLELVYNPNFVIAKDVRSVTGGNGNGVADWAGDVITYQIGMQNIGNITLTGVTVLDQVESYGATGAVLESGDTDLDGDLDVGESWILRATYTLTQADLDNRGGGDGYLDNVVTGNTREVGPKSDRERLDLVYDPDFVIAKDVRSVTGGNGNGVADWAGDVITCQIGMQNTGNVTLTGVTVLDQVETYGATGAILESGDTDLDGDLDVGESWILRATYTLTQADLDNRGGGDRYLDNVVTGNTREVGPKSDRERLELVYDPDFVIAKDVRSVTGGNGNGVADWAGDVITYQIGMQNTGNVTLTGVTVLDQVESYGATGAILESGDTDLDGDLDVGESWILRATYMLTQADLDNRGGEDGYLDNVVTGNTLEVGPKSDRERLELVYQPELAVIKAGVWVDGNQDGLANPGEQILYQFSVTNSGNITLHGVTLTDLVGGVTILGGPIATLGVGETDTTTFTGIYSITQDDIDAGHFYNLALADSEESPPARDDEDVRLPQRQAIAIDKVTADGSIRGDGLTILSGEGIRWIYTVTNPGNVSLGSVTVSDNQAGVTPVYQGGDTDVDGRLDPEETWTYEALGTAVIGNYRNTGTVSAMGTDSVSASDDSGYFGANPGISVNKVTVYGGTEGDGLHIPSGAALEWKYSVTNTGNVPLAGVVVKDDNGTVANTTDDFFANYFGGDDGDGVFEVGETWVFKAGGVSLGGEYTNIGTATGSFTDDAGHSRTASGSDTSSYIGDLQFTTVTLGGWGASPSGNNPGTYLNGHFTEAFGTSGLVVPRTGGADIRLRNPDDVRKFLRATNNNPFTGVNVDGGAVKNYRVSTLEKQYVALALNVRFDDTDASFGVSSNALGDLRLHDLTGSLAAANGLTVREVLGWTYQYLDGIKAGNPLGGLSMGDLTMLVDLLNNSFEGGRASTWAMGHLA